MKYKSELIKGLIDSRGHEKSSIHYQSECIETWIEEAKGGYPKLCDYQAEWLSYINKIGGGGTEQPDTEPPIGEFPYETVTTNTTATVNNVVPYAYKSAILKGDSEVVAGKNKCNMEEIQKGWLDGSSGEVNSNAGVYIPVKVSGTITISNFIHDKNRYVYEYDVSGNYLGRNSVTTNTVTLSLNENTILIKLGFYDGRLSVVKSLELQVEQGEVATEYEPYNPTLVSVKMPVLTTTGKNLFPTSTTLRTNTELGDTGELIYGGGLVTEEYIPLTFFEQCIFSSKVAWLRIAFYDIDKNFISLNTSYSDIKVIFTPPSGAKFFRVSSGNGGGARTPNELQYQIEKGTIPTSYEPFKSNILTVNEDVTLRSNGNVYDELDLLTGKLTQRIDENGEVLSQEIVKTVELSITNQDGNHLSTIKPIEGTMHITPTGEPIAPTAVLEIPVEAVTQNLASFIDLEMEE